MGAKILNYARHVTHGKSKTKTYDVWCSMKARCSNPNDKHYSCYGGRGIKVCARWNNSFLNFYLDMGEAPAGMTLDRIDNDSGYSPENCRWVSQADQVRNSRQNVWLSFNGVTKCARDWDTEFNRSAGYTSKLARTNKLGDGWKRKL